MKSDFLTNSGSILTIFIVVLIPYSIYRLLRRCIGPAKIKKNSHKCWGYILVRIERYYEWNLLFRFLGLTLFPTTIYCVLQLQNISIFYHTTDILEVGINEFVSYGIAVVIMIVILKYLPKLSTHIEANKEDFENRAFLDHYEGWFLGYDINNKRELPHEW